MTIEPPAEVRAALEWFASLEAVDALRADVAAACPGWSPGAIDYVVANDVIATTLGLDWWVKNLGSDDAKAPDYLRVKPTDRAQKYEHVYRVMELARRLFELRAETWFPRLTVALRSRDLPGAVFEVEVIRMLMSLMLLVEPRVPTGGKGEDYDIDVVLSPEFVWAIEAKTRDEDTPYRAGLIGRTLGKARSQLPRGGVGAIFLRIPDSWTGQGTYRREHADEVRQFLQSTTRVHAVVLVWDEWRVRAFSGPQCQRRHRVFISTRCDSRIEPILGYLERVWDGPFDLMAPNAPF